MRKAFKILTITTLALTLALPFTAYAGTWQQDSTGWKVQSDGGTYLTSQWYQSPESGLFYYMGADGYMMVNAITPDGYQVDANGVWNPSVTGTKHVTNGQVDNGSENGEKNQTDDYTHVDTGQDIDWSKYDPADISHGYSGGNINWSAN